MNSAKLEYEMKIRGISIDKMCDLTGIKRTAFYRKRTGKSEFTRSEIEAIMHVLDINDPTDIFFS